jgi:D-inositol-3-phosphate glycosyltransferase
MRLAIVGPVHPLRGGIALHGARLATAARARGHRVQLFSFRRLYPRILFPGRTELDPGPPVESLGEVEPDRSLDPLQPRTWPAIGRAISAAGADVVLLQRWHPFFAACLATVAVSPRRAGARIVWMVHNARPHEGTRLPWGKLLTLGMRAEDRVLTHAPTEARVLAELGVRAEVDTLPMPVPEGVERADRAAAREALGIGSEEVVFLFFGYVRGYKGVDLLLEALADLPEEGRPWRALIVGEWYVDRRPFESALARASRRGRVEVIDRYVAEDEVARYFAAADAVALPYRAGTQSAVIALAYAHERGVIATRVGGLEEAVAQGETGLLANPDARSFGAALQEVRRGRRFNLEALRRARDGASFEALVERLEAFLPASSRPTSLEFDRGRG